MKQAAVLLIASMLLSPGAAIACGTHAPAVQARIDAGRSFGQGQPTLEQFRGDIVFATRGPGAGGLSCHTLSKLSRAG